jgi:hypothetical protein
MEIPMLRRSFLRGILAAPLAIPVVLAAASAEAVAPRKLIGIFGESGPEAIVPLRRGANKLTVEAVREQLDQLRAELPSRIIQVVSDANKSRQL